MESSLRYLTLKLTNNCNLKCKMCGQVYSDTRNGQELTFEIIESCLNSMETIEHIYLFGGEPLLYSRFSELLELISLKKLPALITTNGMLLEQYAESLVLNHIRDIEISIDASDKCIYEAIRINGNLDCVQKGISKLIEMKEKHASEYPRISISCVILPENYLELKNFYKYYTSRYPELHKIIFEFPMRTTAEDGQKTDSIYKAEFNSECRSWQWFCDKTAPFSESAVEFIYEQLEEMETYGKVHIQGPSKEEYGVSSLEKQKIIKDRKCDYPFSTVTILPDGRATFCTDYPDIEIGNLYSTPLNIIWNSDKTAKIRRYMSEHGCFPICGCCTHFYSIISKEKESLL